MSFFKDNPVRNKKYTKWVESLPCSICQVEPAGDHHHIIGVGDGKMGGKACDLLTMPLCRGHHTEMHNNAVYWPEQWKFVSKTLQKAIKDGLIKAVT